ncbi:putative Ig domain-containing protein, partial [Stenotrophomonas maltophilia]|uniref:putative Ig domain-containing protein n=1 Tax=Stenotrophomonas maltophilia TaxID=40324 RepID=UPI0013DD0734
STPSWLNLNPSNGRITGTVPDIAADTPLSVNVQAANGSITAQATASVTLIAAKTVVAGLPATVQAGMTVSGTATTTLPGTPSW